MPDTPVIEAPVVETKPVYSAGNSLGAILKENDAAANTVVVTPPVPDTPVVTPTVETTPVVPVTPPVVEVQKEANVANFSLTEFAGEQPPVTPTTTPETPQAPVEVNWQEAVKKATPDEVLKAVGISDFAIEMDKHIKAGGDPVDYLNAKSIDYNKISDESLVKADLQKQYPTFSGTQIDLMFKRKYEPIDDTPEDKEFADLQLKADAHNSRQAKITEQQKFKIAVPVQQSNAGQDTEKIAAAEKQQMESTLKWYSENEATKTLMTSKRVAVDLGDDGSFNYAVDRPDILMKGILDSETWARMTSVNPKESDVAKLIPDVAKLQRLVLAASNPNYEKDLVNYGKSLALPKLVEEGQNITPPAKVIPVQSPNVNEKELWKTAKTGTVGGR